MKLRTKNIAPQTIRIATYNLQASNQPRLIVTNIQYMVAEGVDVFCLQEIRHQQKKGHILEMLRTTLSKGWQIKCFYETAIPSKELDLCIIWNSDRLQLEAIEQLVLPQVEKLSFIELCQEKLLLANRTIMRRKALIGIFTLRSKKLRISNIHLDWQGGPIHRSKQLQFLLAHLHKKVVSYDIICGDFNTTNWPFPSNEQKQLTQTLGETFTDVSKNIPWSADLITVSFYGFVTPIINTIIHILRLHLYQKVDYVWSRNLQSTDTKIVKTKGSDHFPLIATFTL